MKGESESIILLYGKLKRHRGVSEHKEYQEQLYYEGFHDALSFECFLLLFYVFISVLVSLSLSVAFISFCWPYQIELDLYNIVCTDRKIHT